MRVFLCLEVSDFNISENNAYGNDLGFVLNYLGNCVYPTSGILGSGALDISANRKIPNN